MNILHNRNGSMILTWIGDDGETDFSVRLSNTEVENIIYVKNKGEKWLKEKELKNQQVGP